MQKELTAATNVSLNVGRVCAKAKASTEAKTSKISFISDENVHRRLQRNSAKRSLKVLIWRWPHKSYDCDTECNAKLYGCLLYTSDAADE